MEYENMRIYGYLQVEDYWNTADSGRCPHDTAVHFQLIHAPRVLVSAVACRGGTSIILPQVRNGFHVNISDGTYEPQPTNIYPTKLPAVALATIVC